ncbi:MAG: 50S ribosomal protein L4 [Nitrospirota bacterium]
MTEFDIKDKNNNPVGKIKLPEDIFGVGAKTGTVHNAVVNFLSNQRQGTHATKTKGLVSGGGKKPWRQKHTGRARAGSIRSPLWRGGGIVFGPQPRDYSYSIPRKVKKTALSSVLSEKLSAGEITIIDEIAIGKPRTKDMLSILKNLGLEGKSTLVILPEKDENVVLSARNIPGISVKRVSDLNAYEAAVHSKLLMTQKAVEKLAEAGKK